MESAQLANKKPYIDIEEFSKGDRLSFATRAFAINHF
jgi:hypothetical protein